MIHTKNVLKTMYFGMVEVYVHSLLQAFVAASFVIFLQQWMNTGPAYAGAIQVRLCNDINGKCTSRDTTIH